MFSIIADKFKTYKLNKKIQRNFAKEFEYLKNNNDGRFSVDWDDKWPCLDDKTASTTFDIHYLYHTGWAARKLAEIKPDFHIDIGSYVYFTAIASAICPIKFYDYRPANIHLNNVETHRANLTNLPFEDNTIDSFSCMHVVEHIGLARYGDKLDITGDIKAINEIKRVISPNGNLLFVVPVGKVAKIQFNAHRIYTYEHVLSLFEGFELLDFSIVCDDAKFIQNADKTIANNQEYGCGCFWFKKVR